MSGSEYPLRAEADTKHTPGNPVFPTPNHTLVVGQNNQGDLQNEGHLLPQAPFKAESVSCRPHPPPALPANQAQQATEAPLLAATRDFNACHYDKHGNQTQVTAHDLSEPS